MWQISLKAPQGPVEIPDVMEEYRTTSRILHGLAGKKLDNGQTIFKVSRFFLSKLIMMTHHVNMIQSHICEAMGIDESWLDEGLETLQLVELYGEEGQRYEDSQVIAMLVDQGTERQPCLRLLELLKQCDADWLREGKCFPYDVILTF
jgi:hypothetical protein